MTAATLHRLPVTPPRSTPLGVEPPLGQRVALVSGANRGIGFEVARQLAALGVTVFLGGREAARAEKAARTLREAGGVAHALRLDVTRSSDIQAAVATIEGRLGRIDILVNNAGGYFDTGGRASRPDLDTIRGALEVNLLGTWCLTAAVLPVMRRHGYGRVVNVSSECATRAMCGDDAPAYRISKAALNAYTQVAARELEGSGVLVNAVSPGWTATALGGSGGRPVAEGARGVVWAALLSEREAIHGRFCRDGRAIDW